MNRQVDYNSLITLENIVDVYKIIRKNTKNKGKLFKFEMFYMANINSIYYILRNKLYKHSKYSIFLIQEPKYRIIMSEIISDKVVNHLISKYVLKPLLEPKLINTNIATREGMGSKEGIRLIKKYINSLKINNDKIYVLKCDIKKYFYNIDHEIILNNLRKLIKDKDIYNILESIVNSTDEEYVNGGILKQIEKEINRVKNLNIGDKYQKIAELEGIPLYKKGKGLPIGNMTSQILAVFYLNGLDHYIKEKLYCKYYIR